MYTLDIVFESYKIHPKIYKIYTLKTHLCKVYYINIFLNKNNLNSMVKFLLKYFIK